MPQNYSGRQFKCSIANTKGLAVGNSASVGTHYEMRLTSINDIAFESGFQRTDYVRTGRRVQAQTDHVAHYGSGTYTWSFDYLVENQQIAHTLLENITEQASADAYVQVTGALDSADYSHGSTTAPTLSMIIHHANTSRDRLMHSAILQDLTISMDANTNAGRPSMSGTFMSGYKPLVTGDSTSITATTPDYSKTIFDCGTTTIDGHAVTLQAFSVTVNNPANRIGQRATTGEADGYVRGGNFEVTGTMTVKLDDVVSDQIVEYTGIDTAVPIVVSEGTDLSFSMPTCVITNYVPSWADEGAMVDISFKALASADAELLTFKMT